MFISLEMENELYIGYSSHGRNCTKNIYKDVFLDKEVPHIYNICVTCA